MSADNESKGIDRRDALKRMIWAGTGVIWTLSGGGPQIVATPRHRRRVVGCAGVRPKRGQLVGVT